MSSSANVWIPILVAIVTGLVAVITVYLNGRASIRLEREKFRANSQLEQQKFESNLVLQAIATGNRQSAQKNLEFLVSAGFLADPKGKIKELAKRPADAPVLPAREGAPQMKFQTPTFRWNVRTGSDSDASLVKETPGELQSRDLPWSALRRICGVGPTRIAEPKAWKERSMNSRQ